MKLSTKLVLMTLGLVFVPFLFLVAALFLTGCLRLVNAGPDGGMYLTLNIAASDLSTGHLIFILGIGMAAFIGGMLLMLNWLRIRFSRPMKQLQNAAKAIAEGNLDFELSPDSDDEFGVLVGSFEEMRKRLKDAAETRLRYEQDSKTLISNISQDLKTPITAIKGYVEGIRDGVASSPEKQARYLTTIYNKADDMDGLVDQLAFYALVDSDRIPYHFAKIPAREYFDDCRDELLPELEDQDFDLLYENDLSPELTVIGDPEQLHRVIGNIISNAVKYRDRSKERGRISLKVYRQGAMIAAEIADNGIGISREDLPFIFDRFYRSDTARGTLPGGNGIGLSIVKKIMEDHGGRIRASSKPGEGTVMTMELRLYEEKNNEQNTDSGRREKHSGAGKGLS